MKPFFAKKWSDFVEENNTFCFRLKNWANPSDSPSKFFKSHNRIICIIGISRIWIVHHHTFFGFWEFGSNCLQTSPMQVYQVIFTVSFTVETAWLVQKRKLWQISTEIRSEMGCWRWEIDQRLWRYLKWTRFLWLLFWRFSKADQWWQKRWILLRKKIIESALKILPTDVLLPKIMGLPKSSTNRVENTAVNKN